jgi:hypothetical protein
VARDFTDPCPLIYFQNLSHLQNTLRTLIFSGEIERSLVGSIE